MKDSFWLLFMILSLIPFMNGNFSLFLTTLSFIVFKIASSPAFLPTFVIMIHKMVFRIKKVRLIAPNFIFSYFLKKDEHNPSFFSSHVPQSRWQVCEPSPLLLLLVQARFHCLWLLFLRYPNGSKVCFQQILQEKPLP